jgi:hypothetical protein
VQRDITSSRAIFFFGDISTSSSSGSRLRLRDEVAEEGDWGPGGKRDGETGRARRRGLSGDWKRSRSCLVTGVRMLPGEVMRFGL